MAPIMPRGRIVLAGALAVVTGCFEDPLPPIESSTSGAGSSGDTSTLTASPTSTTSPEPDSTTSPEPTSGTATSAPTTSPDGTTGEPPLACVDGVLEPPLGSGLVEAGTAAAGDDFAGSCGGGGSPDVAYQWDVPYDGFFVLDTQGSDFDTLLYLYDDCGGAELWCNDDAEGSVSSRVVAPFAQGDRVLVVVDGKAGETGTAVLNINPVECPSADLTGQPLPASFSNVAGTNEHGGACGGAGNPERAFRWQAADDGLYAFRVQSEAFPPAVYVEAGPICGGPELGCNGAASGRSEVVRSIAAGQYVTVIADSQGGAGGFDIDVVALGDPCPALPLEPPVAGDINDFPNVMSSSCGPSGYLEGATFHSLPDATFSWTSPGMVGSNSGCNITVSAGFPIALALLEGSACTGPEVQCATGMFDMMAGQYTATVGVGHIPPTDFVLAVSPESEPFLWIGGSGFTIDVACFAVA